MPTVAEGVLINSQGMHSQPPSFYTEEWHDPEIAEQRRRTQGYQLKVNAVDGVMNPLSATFHYAYERYQTVLMACLQAFMAL